MIVAVAVGYAAGGRLANVSKLSLRWAPLALAGLALQFISVPGQWPLILLAISFLLLLVFGIVNRRVRGFTLIILGISLNFLVIGVNHGMPVERHALIASGQQATLTDLVKSGGAKHHIAASDDQLLFLGDVIAIPPPVAQVVSVGDICTYAGVGWLIIAGMIGPIAWRRRGSSSLPVSGSGDEPPGRARRRFRDEKSGDAPSTREHEPRSHDRSIPIRLLEAGVVFPLLAWFAVSVARDSHQFLDLRILVWAAAIAAIDPLPL